MVLVSFCFVYFSFCLHSTCYVLDAITIDAIRVGCVSFQCGCADHIHDVDCTKGEGHPVLSQPLAEVLCLISELVQFVFVLKEKGVMDNVQLSGKAI